MMIKTIKTVLLLGFLLSPFYGAALFAQEGTTEYKIRRVIQFSGIVVEGDSAYGVPGVHVYVPRAGRGTATDYKGFFSMAALVGDTVTISAIGYKKQLIVVPHTLEMGLTVLINLQTDAKMLPIIEIFPFTNVEAFKEAFMELEIKETREEVYMKKNLKREKMMMMAYKAPMSGGQNHRMFMDQYSRGIQMKNSAVSNPLLDVFAWAKFIKSLKNKDWQKDYWKEDNDK